MFEDPFKNGPIPGHEVELSIGFPGCYDYRIPGQLLGIRVTKSMIYHLAASGLLDQIAIIKSDGWMTLLKMDRKEMQKFVSEINQKVFTVLNRVLDGEEYKF